MAKSKAKTKTKAKAKAKAKTKTKRTIEATTSSRAAKKSEGKTKNVNPEDARRKITNIVGNAASAITKAVVVEARKGQLAMAKYLFEAAGIYPLSTEGITDKPEEDSFAQRLVRTLGLPEGPLPGGENNDPLVKVVIPLVNDGVPEENNTEGRQQKVAVAE